MTKRYIDTDEAIKAIADMPNCYNGFSDTYDKACIIGVLEELPTADVQEVRHGWWSHYYDDVLVSGTCSVCGWKSIIMETDVADMPYCPNCGAKMDENQEMSKVSEMEMAYGEYLND